MDALTPELPQFLRLIIALGIVLTLMGGLALLLKRMGLTADTGFKPKEQRRLKVIESIPLDARRRLAIIACDDKQHLIILGANSETVVQNDIPAVDQTENPNQKS